MSDETQKTVEPPAPQLEREERRLERLRLVTQPPEQPWEDDPDPLEAA